MSQALSNLAVGSKVKFGSYSVNGETAQPIVWTIVAKNHTGYPDNSVTLHTSEIIDIRCFDAKEPNNSDSNRQNYGNNRYSVSNIDQWLNKDAAEGSWYSAAHNADHSPDTTAGTGNYNTQYANRPGFLNGFTDNEKAAILSTTIRVVKPKANGGSYEDVVRKVFLPSTTEVGLSNENNIAEGSAWGYHTSNTARIGYVTQQCISNTPSNTKPSSKTEAWVWWLRTPYYLYSFSVWTIDTDGTRTAYSPADGCYGVRPALNLSNTLKVSDTTDSDGCYTFMWPVNPMPWVGGTETYTENETRNVEVSLGDLKEADYADELVSYTVKSGEQTSFDIATGWAFDTGNYCRLEAQGALASGATESCSLTFTKALTGVTIKCEWEGYDTDTDVADTITCYFKGNVIFEKTGTSASHTTDRYTLENVAEGNVVTVSFTRSGTTTKSNGKIREGYTLHFYSDPITITETVPVQKTRGINKPVSSIYAGVTATVPVYTETTTTEDIALSSATFTDFFSADNTGTTGTNAKGITWVDNSGGGLKLTFGNYGINSSTSMTTFTAQRDLTNVVISGLYYTETRYDKITLTVAGSTVLNAVSGTSSTLTQRWTGSLSKGQTIVLKFVKDSSASASNEKSTYFTLSCDPYQKTTVNKTQTGTETKLVDKKIVKGYVGGPDGKARLFFGENTPPISYSGDYEVFTYSLDGKPYDVYRLNTSGELTCSKGVEYWACGGGASGWGGTDCSPYCGLGGASGFIDTGLLEKGTYAVTIGAGGAATAKAGSSTVINGNNTFSIMGGKTGSFNTNGVFNSKELLGNSSGGGSYSVSIGSGYSDVSPSAVNCSDGKNVFPFGIYSLMAHCASGGGGGVAIDENSTIDAGHYCIAGKGSGFGQSGGYTTGKSGGTYNSASSGAGGYYGGGSGGPGATGPGGNATFYGSGGGGGSFYSTVTSSSMTGSGYGKGGAGYQGACYLLTPSTKTSADEKMVKIVLEKNEIKDTAQGTYLTLNENPNDNTTLIDSNKLGGVSGAYYIPKGAQVDIWIYTTASSITSNLIDFNGALSSAAVRKYPYEIFSFVANNSYKILLTGTSTSSYTVSKVTITSL